MPGTVFVTLELESAAAAVLRDETKRAWVGQIVSRMLESPTAERLFETMNTISAEARHLCLTDEMLQAELDVYNAERRDRPPAA